MQSDIDQGDTKTKDIFSRIQGPVAGLRQAATLLGGRLESDSDGFKITFNGTTTDLYINKGTNKDWKIKATKVITEVITMQLNERLVDPGTDDIQEDRGLTDVIPSVLAASGPSCDIGAVHGVPAASDPSCDTGAEQAHSAPAASAPTRNIGAECEGQDRNGNLTEKKGRQDLYGVGNAIDKFATSAITAKKYKDILEDVGLQLNIDKTSKDPIQNLSAAGLIETKKCSYCNHEDATLRHTVWQCEKWKADRQPYINAIDAYIDTVAENDHRRKQKIMHLLAKPCVHNCGVMPETLYFKRGGAKIPSKQARYCQKNTPLTRLNVRQTESLDLDEQERVTAYTDGTACNPDDYRRRRAAWGVHYAHGHEWNCNGPIPDELQTVYRAELMAVNHVIQSAIRPTHIVSDCLSVVNTLRDVIAGVQTEIKGDHLRSLE